MLDSLDIGKPMKIMSRPASARVRWNMGALAVLLLSTTACTSVGPGTGRVAKASQSELLKGIQVVNLDDQTVRSYTPPARPTFAQALGVVAPVEQIIGVGDSLQIGIWEAPPAVLFGGGASSVSELQASTGTALPEYLVGISGRITVPFAGSIPVVGLTPDQLEREVTRRLFQKAHLPQVSVRITKNASSNVAVVGAVKAPIRVPLSPKGETILDVLAAAGGTNDSVEKVTIQISREGRTYTMPMDSVIRDPQQNVVLRAGDVVTALYQPYSFTALGAVGSNGEVNFESTGITLAQAMGRLSGLQENRADPKGVFIFRWEDPAAIPNLDTNAPRSPDGKVPIIYRIDMKEPATYFVMQNFPIRNKDVVFVSNSMAADFQRFISVVSSTAMPIITFDNALRRN